MFYKNYYNNLKGVKVCCPLQKFCTILRQIMSIANQHNDKKSANAAQTKEYICVL